MDYGVIFLSQIEIYKDVMIAEEKGYTHAWFGDSQMVWSDVYQCMALCATHTDTIKLGTNVTNPSSRIAPVTACSFGTLNVLAPGRIIMGIGTGNTARRTLGMPAAKLADLRANVEVCRGLLKGDTVPYQEGERQRQIRFLNPNSEFVNLKNHIPIHVAGSGPRTLELAGEIGDGVILFGTVGDSLLKYTLDHIGRGAERSGRTLNDIYVTVVTAFHLRKPDEDLAALQQIVGPLVTSECNIFALSVKDPFQLPGDIRDDLMAFKYAYRQPTAPIETRHLELYSGYCEEFKPEHAPLVTEKMIRETTLTGTATELQERVQTMKSLGVSQVSIAGGAKEIGEFAEHVIPYID